MKLLWTFEFRLRNLLKLKSLLISIFTLLLHSEVWSSTKDYAALGLNDQNIKFGLGASYSKLETFSETGNYFLISDTNPKIEFRYESGLVDQTRHFFGVSFVGEQFKVENAQFLLKEQDLRVRARTYYQPKWYNESGIFGYGLHLGVKWSTLISQVPTPFELVGDIDDLLTGEAGIHLVWYGQTVRKLPMNVDFSIAHVGTLYHHSENEFGEGLTYQFGLNFDFSKRSYFSNWSIRGFYEFEEIKTDLNPQTSKEVGITIFKVAQF